MQIMWIEKKNIFHAICCLSVADKYDILLTIKLTAWRRIFLMEFGSV